MESKVPSDKVIVRNARLAVAAELKKKRILNQPIAKFDAKTRKITVEYSDGRVKDFGACDETGKM